MKRKVVVRKPRDSARPQTRRFYLNRAADRDLAQSREMLVGKIGNDVSYSVVVRQALKHFRESLEREREAALKDVLGVT